MKAGNLELCYGEKVIGFTLERRPRKTLSISVRPNLQVEVVAPVDAALDRILDKVRRRAAWIQRQIQFFSQFQPRTTPRQFASGETHLYLGRQYKLKVVLHVQQEVKLYRGRLFVQSHRPHDVGLTKELIERWYRERAQTKFRERVAACREKFPKPALYEPSGLIVRQLQQRWGSMTLGRKLILNVALIRSSVDTIDYVITHELCHIRHDHHGPEFYKLLDRVMPDWENRKAKLERQLA